MKLSSFLDPSLIFTDIQAETKDQAIEKLVELTAKADKHFSKQKENIRKAILDRENLISTAMENKVALPHARVEGYEDVLVSIGIIEEPISCQLASQKEGEVSIFFLIVTNKVKNEIMLHILSGISKLAERPENIENILKCSNSSEVYSYIKDLEINLKEGLSVEDIMTTDIKPAYLGNTLEEIARRLVSENRVGLPVTDEKGYLLGEITERELIEFGMPNYTSVMEDLSFVTTGEPFKEFFEKENYVTVKELYRENPLTISKDTSVMQLCFLIMSKGNTRVYVVEDGKFLGMIVRSDIIKRVLQI